MRTAPFVLAALCLALLLSTGAIANGFPLIFPDSGTYLGIALGHEYAIDRSSFYGLWLKPFVNMAPGVGGLWLAIFAQAFAVAAVLIGAARALIPETSITLQALWMIPVALLTALPWHAGQFMPDAFTGPLVLLIWMAALRDPGEDGASMLWLAAVAAALTHYTHLILLAVVAAAVIGAGAMIAPGLRAAWRRALVALLAVSIAAGALIGANGLALGRWALSPTGSLFLFARLNEDGLIQPWLDRHCGHDAPAPLCAVRGGMPVNSQTLLWGGNRSWVTSHIWQARDDAARWRWIAMMGDANRGAISEQPLKFLTGSVAGTVRQFLTFSAIDDECPGGCREYGGGINFTLLRYRPETVPLLQRSMQVRDTTPKALVKPVTSVVAWIAILLLPAGLTIAWRRRDVAAFTLLAGISTALIANAAMAGALSDVHDRYQSRIVWLVPFALLFLALRWRMGAGIECIRLPRLMRVKAAASPESGS